MDPAAGPIGSWLPADLTLADDDVRLEPLTLAHRDELFDAGGDAEVWRWSLVRQPRTRAEMGTIIETALALKAKGERMPFVIVDLLRERVVGTTSYLDIAPRERRIEIGWTWIGRQWWRTGINRRAKLLLLGYAFDELAVKRVSLKTDIFNVRSQAAIERLGARREGVLRNFQVRADGSSRDTVYFGITDADWAARAAG